MKNLYRIVIAVMLLLPIMFSNSYAEESGEKAWVGEPILVSLNRHGMLWCGSDALIYGYQESSPDRYIESEEYWYDINTRRKVLIGKETDDFIISSLDCTPDGKWLIYINFRSSRWGESKDAYIQDLWRYEVATGKHEKIAITNEIPNSQVNNISPDSNRIFLGTKPPEEIEMPEPKLEIVWSEIDVSGDVLWTKDSSAVIASKWVQSIGTDNLVIETIEPKRETIVFSLADIQRSALFFLDSKGRIYRYYWVNEKSRVARCTLNSKEKSFVCEDIFIEGNSKIEDFEIFADGEFIAFTEKNGSCVKAIKVGEDKAHCITPPIDTLGNYRIPPGGSIKVSPDDRWLAFYLVLKGEAGEGVRLDQYIVELSNK